MRRFPTLIATALLQGISDEYTIEVLVPFSEGEDRSRPWEQPLPACELLALMGTCEPRSVLTPYPSIPLGRLLTAHQASKTRRPWPVLWWRTTCAQANNPRQGAPVRARCSRWLRGTPEHCTSTALLPRVSFSNALYMQPGAGAMQGTAMGFEDAAVLARLLARV